MNRIIELVNQFLNYSEDTLDRVQILMLEEIMAEAQHHDV